MDDALVSAINARHGLQLTLGERYPRGEQGAFAVHDATGAEFVLKWSIDTSMRERIHRASLVTDHLRDRGYPVSRYRFHGVVDDVYYTLREALPGQPIGTVSLAHLPRLLELNALQRGSSPLAASNWPQSIVGSVLNGCDGYCVVASLDGYSRTTRALLAEVQGHAARYSDTACPTADIVHFDFNPVNILADDGRVSGVVDWDGTMTGDCTFDLVTLLFYARRDHEARRALWRHLGIHSTLGAVSLYLAHLTVRQVDWSIRHHDEQTIELWVDNACSLLRELAASG
jgi:hypothetical protein